MRDPLFRDGISEGLDKVRLTNYVFETLWPPFARQNQIGHENQIQVEDSAQRGTLPPQGLSWAPEARLRFPRTPVRQLARSIKKPLTHYC